MVMSRDGICSPWRRPDYRCSGSTLHAIRSQYSMNKQSTHYSSIFRDRLWDNRTYNFSNGIRIVWISIITTSVIVLDGPGRPTIATLETYLDTTVATVNMVVEVLFKGECWKIW